MTKLCQAIAIEKGVKNNTQSAVTAAHQLCQKAALFNGFKKTYSPKDSEDTEIFPDEGNLVQKNAEELLHAAGNAWRELFDVTAVKDWGNTVAKADVVVNGQTVIHDAPVPYLLFLEKQLVDIRTFVSKMPTLDPSKTWAKDENGVNFRTDERASIKTKKVPRSLVLHEGNENHPPQTQMIAEDITVGYWHQVDFSGAIPEKRRDELLARVDTFLKAVKMAREEANSTELMDITAPGDSVINWLFAD